MTMGEEVRELTIDTVELLNDRIDGEEERMEVESEGVSWPLGHVARMILVARVDLESLIG